MIDSKGENCMCVCVWVMLYEMWRGIFQTFAPSVFFHKIVTNLNTDTKWKCHKFHALWTFNCKSKVVILNKQASYENIQQTRNCAVTVI
jgi:hypothetical protein